MKSFELLYLNREKGTFHHLECSEIFDGFDVTYMGTGTALVTEQTEEPYKRLIIQEYRLSATQVQELLDQLALETTTANLTVQTPNRNSLLS